MEQSFTSTMQRMEERIANDAAMNSRRHGEGRAGQAQMATIMERLTRRLDAMDERATAHAAPERSELDDRGATVLRQGQPDGDQRSGRSQHGTHTSPPQTRSTAARTVGEGLAASESEEDDVVALHGRPVPPPLLSPQSAANLMELAKQQRLPELRHALARLDLPPGADARALARHAEFNDAASARLRTLCQLSESMTIVNPDGGGAIMEVMRRIEGKAACTADCSLVMLVATIVAGKVMHGDCIAETQCFQEAARAPSLHEFEASKFMKLLTALIDGSNVYPVQLLATHASDESVMNNPVGSVRDLRGRLDRLGQLRFWIDGTRVWDTLYRRLSQKLGQFGLGAGDIERCVVDHLRRNIAPLVDADRVRTLDCAAWSKVDERMKATALKRSLHEFAKMSASVDLLRIPLPESAPDTAHARYKVCFDLWAVDEVQRTLVTLGPTCTWTAMGWGCPYETACPRRGTHALPCSIQGMGLAQLLMTLAGPGVDLGPVAATV
jgi:hypothetical protein